MMNNKAPTLRLSCSMKAGGFFQSSDLPQPEHSVRFQHIDLPVAWACIPFTLPLKYTVFSAEKGEIRKIPGFIIRTGENKIVAYSRLCTYCRHSQPVNFVKDPSKLRGEAQSNTPVLSCPCPCDASTFDINDNGRVLSGPAYRPLRRMNVVLDGDYVVITGLDQGGIA